MKSEVWKRNYKMFFQQHKLIHKLVIMSYIRRCSVCNKKYIKIDRKPKDENDLSILSDKRNMCYECAFWTSLIENKKPDGFQIVNGVCYQILPFVKDPKIYMFLGGNGEKRFFVTKDMKIMKSNDVWRIGKIPEQFRDKLPDTGWFCDKRAYSRLFSFNRRCNEIGCLDRYKCFRFKTELEIANGPFNELPNNWVDGGEHCKYFINTDLIENYVSPIIKKVKNGKRNEKKNG